jgi:transcriptional regulator with XRE-family HTH domain
MDGARITRKRESMNLTQQDLADLADVSMHTIFRAEKGANIQSNNLSKIAVALGVSVAYLMGEDNVSSTIHPSPETNDSILQTEKLIANHEPVSTNDNDPAVELVKNDRFIRNLVIMMSEMPPEDLADATRFIAEKKELAELRRLKGA